jgi:tRNA dimethylallyltransferase
MAIYRRMDIGTAKPSRQDLQKVAHHLIDIAEPHEEYSVAEFVKHAARIAEEIIGRQRVPLFVGGTGLYLRSVLRGLFEGPEPDWGFREAMEQLAIKNGPQWLHGKLAACDPITAERLHLNDMRRIIRALEVFELTGRPISEDQQHSPLSVVDRPRVVAWLEPPREWLRARIDLRVDQMMSEFKAAEKAPHTFRNDSEALDVPGTVWSSRE